MKSKLMSQKKKNPATKKNAPPVSTEAIKEQYRIIRGDILKLREDLSKGYDMARGIVEKKGLISQFLKAK